MYFLVLGDKTFVISNVCTEKLNSVIASLLRLYVFLKFGIIWQIFFFKAGIMDLSYFDVELDIHKKR